MPRITRSLGISDSLLGSLCREMAGILGRRSTIQAALLTCQDAGLIRRLRQEIDVLARRQQELAVAADGLRKARTLDPLGVAFFRELTRRGSLA